MTWQTVTIKDMNAVVEVLKELPYKSIVVGHKYSSGQFGRAYDNVSELMGEMESLREFDTIDVYRSYLEDVFYVNPDDEDGDDSETVNEMIAKAEKIGAPFAVYSNGRDEIYTKNGDSEIINEYLSDSMNGHSFSGSIQEAIELIEEQIATGSALPLRKDVAEIVTWVADKFKYEFTSAREGNE